MQDEARTAQFFFTMLNQAQMEANIERDRAFSSEQYAHFNPYNHIFYTSLKFQDFILDSKSGADSQKGRADQRTSPPSTCCRRASRR